MTTVENVIEQVPVLSISGAALSRGPRALMRDFSFSLAHGELVGILGPSGCGKTTLLRSLAGLQHFDAGRPVLHGAAPGHHDWPGYRCKVMLLSQQPQLLDLSVRENFERPFQYAAQSGSFQKEEALALMERLHLPRTALGQLAHSLSVGQQQRVSLIRSLLLQPEVLLLDEPTSALDEASRDAVEALITEYITAPEHAGVVVAHDQQQLQRWATRIIDVAPYLTEEARHGE